MSEITGFYPKKPNDYMCKVGTLTALYKSMNATHTETDSNRSQEQKGKTMTFQELVNCPEILSTHTVWVDTFNGREQITSIFQSRTLGPCARLNGGYTNTPLGFNKPVYLEAK